jgi:hypothetical protein
LPSSKFRDGRDGARREDHVSRLRIVAGATALVSVGLLFGGLLPASSQGASDIRACEYERRGTDVEVDADGSGGFSAGDYSLSHDPLFQPGTNDRRIGKVVVHLDFVKLKGQQDAIFHAVGTWLFENGRITGQTFSKFSNVRKGITAAITGGTGAYRNASGQITVQEGRCNGKQGLRFHVQLS